MKTETHKNEAFAEALVTVRKARNKVEAVRDAIEDLRPQLSLGDQGDLNYLQRLFEAPFTDVAIRTSLTARSAVFYEALDKGGPLMSIFNEYAVYMDLANRALHSSNTNFERQSNAYATEVAEANNPISAAYSILRKNKNLTPNQTTTILEAAHPLATNGLDEGARDYLYLLASDRGVTLVEIANAYGELVDLLMAVRFSEDHEGYPEEE